MASAVKASQTLSNSLAAAFIPRNICRTCKHKLLQHEARQIRHNSGSSILRRNLTPFKLEQRRSVSYGSELADPNRTRQHEPLPELQLPDENVTYEPAETWDGLETMGHDGHWKDLPADPKDDYEPWLAPSPGTPPQRNELLSLLWVAVVECIALKQLKKSPLNIDEHGPLDFLGGMASLQIVVSHSGMPSSLHDPEDVLKKMEQILDRQEDNDAANPLSEEVNLSVPEVENQLSRAKFDFRDPMTFAILKHFSQLIGQLVPDQVLSKAMRDNLNLTDFVELFAERTKPKPKKFAELLLAKQEEALTTALEEEDPQTSASPPQQIEEKDATGHKNKDKKQKPKFEPLGQNVKILPRRETEISLEKEVGRWKVIERELEKRGLPVYPGKRRGGETWL